MEGSSRRTLPVLLAIIGWSVVAVLGGVAAARLLAHDTSFPLIALNAFTTYLYLPVWGVLVGALFGKRWWMAGAAGAIALLHVAWIHPESLVARAVPEEAAAAPRLRVMTANLLMVNRDTAGIVGEILAARPDVLLVQELAPQWEAALAEPEVRALLPHEIHVAREDSFGIGIYARAPLREAELRELEGLPYVRAVVEVGGRALTIYNIHTLPPRTQDYTPVWDRMMAAVVEMVESEPGAVLLAGDLNATPHSAWYRRLVSGRLRGAHEDRGRGWATTWPNGIFPLPGIRLDHALVTGDVACLGVREGEGRGSDHQPLIVDLALLGRDQRTSRSSVPPGEISTRSVAPTG